MAQESEQAMMQVGLDLLYAENDPGAAAAQFRRVLEQNPSHYGATFQLATALDRGGQPDQARTVWERMLRMAEAIGDGPTADQARARLAQEPLTQEALMKAGLDLLYPGNDPAAAAALFRQVLERNPTHYGATFQLATALDRAGEVAEARPLWDKVLEMAEGYNDAETAATARTRLAR
jgi:Tfp pilus assembly protein PilF